MATHANTRRPLAVGQETEGIDGDSSANRGHGGYRTWYIGTGKLSFRAVVPAQNDIRNGVSILQKSCRLGAIVSEHVIHYQETLSIVPCSHYVLENGSMYRNRHRGKGNRGAERELRITLILRESEQIRNF